MKARNGKIVEITEDELFDLYLKRGLDEVMDFNTCIETFKKYGCEVIFNNKEGN